VADLDSTYRPHLTARLEAGEELRGLCVASQQKSMFKGGAVVLGVTDRRLLVQPLTKRGEPGGGEAQRLGLDALAEWFRAIDT
jgi:hypothetical protein